MTHLGLFQPGDRKNFEFLNIQGGGSRHLENHKNCDISATVGSVFTKFGMLAQNWPVNHPGHYKFFPFENVMWQTATILKIEKLLKIFRKFSFLKLGLG